MKYLFRSTILGLMLLTISQSVFSQEKKKLHHLPISISVFNESTALPFTRLFTVPIHPGFQIGTEFTLKQKKSHRLYETVNFGYYYHNYMAQGAYLNTEIGYEFRAKFGLAVGALLGFGYLHTFATQAEYRLIDGEYVRKFDKGNPRFMPSLTIDLGYYIRSNQTPGTKIFLKYQAWAQYPFSPGFIPIMTHINLHLGVKFHISIPKK